MPDAETDRRRDRLYKFDIVSKFLLGLAGLVLSTVISIATYQINRAAYQNNRAAAERQVQNQNESIRAQRESVGAQAAINLLPTILKGSERERGAAEAILLSIAPKQLETIVAGRSRSAANGGEQGAEQQTMKRAVSRQQEIAFFQHLDNAVKYREFLLDAHAAREFMSAGEIKPDRLKDRIGASAFDEGKRLYSKARFSEAVAKFEEAFGRVKAAEGRP